jgi:hypothetical protein
MSTILPILQDFDISSPVFIRKLDKRSDWDPDVVDTDRPRRVAEMAFQDADRIFSLYYVTNSQEFYSAIVALNANRSPQNNNTDFIWITREELTRVGIQPELFPEGRCRQASGRHFNATISMAAAIALCQDLFRTERQAYRCAKKSTVAILAEYRTLGCYALIPESIQCKCAV